MSAGRHAYHGRMGKDWYKVLRVPHTATTEEIKDSYRRLALQLHPDRHDGCSDKIAQFKQVTEAYAVLTDRRKRMRYDSEHGFGGGGGRRAAGAAAAAAFAQKHRVYAPRPPPQWKHVWDHDRHQDMHYGTGQQREAIKHARESAKREGAFEYRSPLGEGFSFSSTTTGMNGSGSSNSNNKNNNMNNYNPYSKLSPQGPPTVAFDYEEAILNMETGKQHQRRRERIVDDMMMRRNERLAAQAAELRRQQQRYTVAFGTAAAAAASRRQDDECVVL